MKRRSDVSAVCFFPVFDRHHIDGPVGIIDLVKDAVISNAQTPGETNSFQFQGLGWARIFGQPDNAFPNIVADRSRNVSQVFFEGRLEFKLIGRHVSLGGTQILHGRQTVLFASRRKFLDRLNLPIAVHNHQHQEGPQCGSLWGLSQIGVALSYSIG